ncbi:MAG: hypothetical protein PHH54_03915 [Candidatus Nanoarchaeia archaeon]|nr:hypothetical protein [Candidatus Nanoarchaeia archaeon]MDD5741106.1 hypothetical protein [Candidatus Nanoarchaeia archaeon]
MALETLTLIENPADKINDSPVDKKTSFSHISSRQYLSKTKPLKEMRKPFNSVILTPEIKKIILPKCRCYYEFREVGLAKWIISFYEEIKGDDNPLRHYIPEGMREMEIAYRKCYSVKGYPEEYLLPAPLHFYDKCYGNNIKKYDCKGNLLKVENDE